jgi:hypothetical protein
MAMSNVRFYQAEVESAADTWGLNCGPAAVAAICNLTLDELRPHLGDFEAKRYTNPTLMWSILNSIGAKWRLVTPARTWPAYGLARVQWEGPWTAPGVPARVSYRFSHWIGAQQGKASVGIFDVNAMNTGGWIDVNDWAGILVPWLLKQVAPKADGRWHLTHVVEVGRD